MIPDDVVLYFINQYLVQSSSGRLPTTADGSGCRDPQPNIRSREHQGWRSLLGPSPPGLWNPTGERGRIVGTRRAQDIRRAWPVGTLSRTHGGSQRLKWQFWSLHRSVLEVLCIYVMVSGLVWGHS